jgi:hypothetical protein
MFRLLAYALLGLAITAVHAAAHRTWIVDPNGGGDHTSLQAAIDAAGDGDVLALRPGHYLGQTFVTIAGKGLVVVGHPGGTCRVGTLIVVDLPSTSEVVLRNLVVPGINAGQESLIAEDCTGRVRVEDCMLLADGGVRLHRCNHATLSRSSVRSAFSTPQFVDPPTYGALQVFDSLVIVDDTVIEGAQGEAGISGGTYCTEGENGTPGLVVIGSSHARLARSHVIGGLGGAGGVGGAGCNAGQVAPAIYAAPGAHVALRDVTISGPVKGAGSVVALSGPARSLDVTGNVPSRGRVHLAASGAPGELVFGLFSLGGSTLDLGPETGVYESAAVIPGGRRLLGVLDGSGQLELEVDAPSVLDARVETWTVQAAFVDAVAGVRFAPATTVQVVGERARVAAAGTVVFVDAAAPPGGTGRAWASAIADLHEAAERAWSLPGRPVQVWVRAGRYLPTWTGGSRLDSLTLLDGVELLGGFMGQESAAEQRDPVAHAVVLDGDLLGDDGPAFTRRADNARDLIVRSGGRSGTALLDGFRLRGAEIGSALFATAPIHARRCLVFDNRATFWATVSLRPEHGEMSLETSTLRGNSGPALDALGGALGTIHVASCAIHANDGGSTNIVRLEGTDSVELTNCTVAQNRVPAGRAAVSFQALLPAPATTPLIRHSILWGNVAGGASGYTAQLAYPVPLVASSTTRNVIAGYPNPSDGSHNVALDPLFVDSLGPDGIEGSGDEDLRLRSGSPAVDSGDNGLVPVWLVEDLDGAPRRSDDPATPDTGLGAPPIVDRGAYERH